MFNLSDAHLLGPIEERALNDALMHRDLIEEWTRVERSVGGTAALKAALALGSPLEQELDELRHPERAFLREISDQFSGRAAMREAMEWATGHTVQREVARMLAPVSSVELHRTMVDRLVAEASELNAARERMHQEALGYFTFSDVTARTEIDRFASAVRSISPGVCIDSALRAAMALQAPWIDASAPGRSFEAFAAVSEIARVVEDARSSHDLASEHLRSLVGSWSPADPVAFAVSSAAERAAGFRRSGIDVRVFDLPAVAFPEVARVTGLAPSRSISVRATPTTTESAVVIEASGSLSDDATLQVRSVERMLRRELRQRMPRHFGEKWIAARVPEKMRRQWEERKERARGRMCTDLLDYSYFGDLVQIIMQRGVWETAFKPSVDMSKEEFQIATNRLIGVRNVLHHAGDLEGIEFIWCFSEVTQLRRAFGAPQNGEDGE